MYKYIQNITPTFQSFKIISSLTGKNENWRCLFKRDTMIQLVPV